MYGGFIDAVCDKVYVVLCWISLLHSIIPNTLYFVTVQLLVLVCLIVAKMTGGFIRFRAYYTSMGVSTPIMDSMCKLDFSTSAVRANHLGKAKQTFEMVSTALYILPVGIMR
jgi:phosphatidylglycerophosphate synthase